MKILFIFLLFPLTTFANTDDEILIRPAAMMDLAFNDQGVFQPQHSQNCKAVFKATPADNVSYWKQWSPGSSLHLNKRIRPEIVNGKTHVGYQFKTCTSIYPNGKNQGRVMTCLEMNVDCSMPQAVAVRPDNCLIAENFDKQYILSTVGVSDDNAAKNCTAASAAAPHVDPAMLSGKSIMENGELFAPARPASLISPKPVEDISAEPSK